MSTLSPGTSAPPRPAEPSPPPRRTSSFASSLSSLSRGGGGGSSRHSATALSRQAARFGIVTNYRDLNLHSAAAKGNVGLVQYALANGQPVNSVLDGVLPIHAAASSGNETVVRMLVEAGADVNSPRLSRRFTREGTKSSGQSVGTRGESSPSKDSSSNRTELTETAETGSTPLHFAAANGHLLILSLLLSYGADPRVPEKHGATAEQMAAQNGFLDAADLLHSYCVKHDQAAAEANGGNGRVASSSSARSHRHDSTGSGRTFAGLRRKSSASSGSTPAMQAQRSLDALATKFAHHAHRASSSSSLSVNSLRGLTPLASSSQISLGAADGPAPLGPVPVRRRPSLPGGTMQPVLEVANDGRVRAATFSGTNGSGQQAFMSTAFTTNAPQAPEQVADEEDAAVERAERRRSMDVNRPWRQDSFQTGLPTLASLDMASLPALTDLTADPDQTPTDAKTALLPASAPTSPTRTLPQQRFYRPRQSSGLSRGSFTGSRGSIEEDPETRVFEDDELPPVGEPSATAPDETTTTTKPNRPRAVSNPDSRSPLLQHLHATQYSGARSSRSRENSHSETTPPAKQGQNLAVPNPTPTRATQSDGRARSNSASTDASYTVSTSSSRDSTWSGPTFSTASTSTAPTTAPPHSPTKRTKTSTTVTPDVGYFGAATTALDLSNRRRHLGPLYEAHSPGIATTRSTTTRTEEAVSSTTNDHEPKTRAQARSRVKKAERELMGSLAPASASASSGSTSVQRETVSAPKSLKDQLAAYGKSLRAERELVEKEERERQRHVKSPAASGYTIETISTSGVAKARSNLPPNPLNASTTRGSGKLLLPPSPPSSRRSRSPGSSAATTPRALREVTASSPSKARSPHMEQVRASSPSSTRSGSNQSASTAEAVPVASAAAAAAPPVLGQGHGGVSYVGVQPPTRSHHRHHHQHHHSSNSSSNHRKDGPAHARNGSRTARSSDKSQSDRDLASVVGGSSSNGGAPSNSNAGKISTRDGVEEERRKREEEEHKVPRAARTVPAAGRSGFVRKLFGRSSSKESGGASASRR